MPGELIATSAPGSAARAQHPHVTQLGGQALSFLPAGSFAVQGSALTRLTTPEALTVSNATMMARANRRTTVKCSTRAAVAVTARYCPGSSRASGPAIGAAILANIARAIDAERQCCRVLRFSITVEPDGGPISVELTGRRQGLADLGGRAPLRSEREPSRRPRRGDAGGLPGTRTVPHRGFGAAELGPSGRERRQVVHPESGPADRVRRARAVKREHFQSRALVLCMREVFAYRSVGYKAHSWSSAIVGDEDQSGCEPRQRRPWDSADIRRASRHVFPDATGLSDGARRRRWAGPKVAFSYRRAASSRSASASGRTMNRRLMRNQWLVSNVLRRRS